MEFKDIASGIKEFDSDKGTFVGLAAAYNNVDLGNDLIEPGAFVRTIKNADFEVPLCWQHDMRTPIGMGRLEDTPRGLKVHGTLNLNTQTGMHAYELMKPMAGFKRAPVRGLSIGYESVKSTMVDGVRHLKECKLYEVSPVTVGMNPQATISRVKQFEYDNDVDSLREQVALLIQAVQSIKATLATKGISCNDPDVFHSLAAYDLARLGTEDGNPPDVSSLTPGAEPRHLLELLGELRSYMEKSSNVRGSNCCEPQDRMGEGP
jgi:hypothetical protein